MSSQEENENIDSYISIDDSKEEYHSDRNVDLLTKRLELIQSNAPQTQEEFYKNLFEIFSNLLSHVNTHHSKTLDEINDERIRDFIDDYQQLSYDYQPTNEYALVWILVEKLFFPENNDYASALREFVDEFSLDNSYDEGDIWETVQHKVICGCFEDAIALLEDSMESILPENHSSVETLIDLIINFRDIQQDVDNKALYKEKWSNWNQSCQSNKSSYAASVPESTQPENKHILKLYSILTGDISSDNKFNFFEQVVGTLLYVRPLAGLSSLNNLAQNIKANTSEKSVESICVQLVRGCYEEALDSINNQQLWLQTHLGHVLIVLGYYNKNEESLTKLSNGEEILSPVYYSIYSYAATIAKDFNMWNESIAYLSVCQDNNEIWAIELLGTPVLPTKDIEELQVLLETSKEYNMFNVQKHIHWSMGKRYEDQSAIKEATIEYGKAHDLESLDRIAHQEFNEYLKHGTLDHVATDMEELKESPHYAVLIQYRLFKEYLKHNQWKDASNALLLLLKNKRLPAKFETVLLIDNLNILEESEHYYLSDQMLELLDIFKKISNESENGHFISKYYKFVQHKELSSDVVIAKLRESLAYKAATAPKVF